MPWFTKQTKKKERNTLPCLWGSEFRLFRRVSRQILAVSGRFGHIGRRPIRPNSSQISPVRRKLKPIQRESSRVGANPRKKKKTQTRHQRMGNHIGRRVPRRTRVRHPPSRIHAFLGINTPVEAPCWVKISLKAMTLPWRTSQTIKNKMVEGGKNRLPGSKISRMSCSKKLWKGHRPSPSCFKLSSSLLTSKNDCIRSQKQKFVPYNMQKPKHRMVIKKQCFGNQKREWII